MGMYTELLLRVEIKHGTPENVKSILNYMFNPVDDATIQPELPDHALFKSPRWEFIGKGCSFYHVPFHLSKYDQGYIFSRSDFKNYDNEISLFMDWIKPYLDHKEGDLLGWEWYEENDNPTLLRYK